MKKVVASSKKAGKISGIYCGGGAIAARNAELGFDFLAIGSDQVRALPLSCALCWANVDTLTWHRCVLECILQGFLEEGTRLALTRAKSPFKAGATANSY
jgi:hypothetical protein